MREDENEQKYPFLLVFLQFCGLRGTSKYMSLAGRPIRHLFLHKTMSYRFQASIAGTLVPSLCRLLCPIARVS